MAERDIPVVRAAWKPCWRIVPSRFPPIQLFERVTDPAEIVPAIKRGIAQTQAGTPALLEFITQKEIEISKF